MYRNKIEELKSWKDSPTRKPLIIRGARQVGKTWLMKEFGSKYYEKCAYINFDDNSRMNKLFDEDFDLDRIIQGLKIESGVNIEPENTLIILDEIQETPKALKALKYFCENARQYHIVSAGSLLGVAIHEGTSFPVGKVDFMDLMPLSFFEFLDALGEKELLNLLKENDFQMIEVFNTKFKEYLKLYYYVGGMPEAVNAYATNKDLKEVRKIQNELLAAYEQDFSKHAPSNIVPRIRQLWNNIPTQLARENKKFIYGLIKEGARAREYEGAVNWLNDANIIYKIYNVNKPNLPLKAYEDLSAFKIYLNDVGLLRKMAELDSNVVIEGNKIFTEFKGALTENYILQMLLTAGLKTNYFSFDNKYEIDYILQNKNEIIPIEVKANEVTHNTSLNVYNTNYEPKTRVRFSMKNLQKDGNLINIPLFMAEYLEKFI